MPSGDLSAHDFAINQIFTCTPVGVSVTKQPPPHPPGRTLSQCQARTVLMAQINNVHKYPIARIISPDVSDWESV